MVSYTAPLLQSMQKRFRQFIHTSINCRQISKKAQITTALTLGGALIAGCAFGAEKSFRAQWGFPNPPPNTSGFTFWYRLAEHDQPTALGSVSADTYSIDFMGAVGKRFYASVSADFTDGTSSRSTQIPVLAIDERVVTSLPSGANSITLPSGQRLDALMDGSHTYVNGIVTTPPKGFKSYDNGTSRYYGNHYEQVFINDLGNTIRIYPVDDFTGETAGPITTIGYDTSVRITGYVRNPSATGATAPDSLGNHKNVHAVVIVEKPYLKHICRVNYTAEKPSDYTLQRIYYTAADYTTNMDEIDMQMTTHNFYLDPNGDQWYGSVNATGRKMRIRKWTAANVEQTPIDIDFDNLVVAQRSLPSIPSSQKIFKYVRQLDGKHFFLATIDKKAIITYELDSEGNPILTKDGLGVKKIVQGPFAGGSAVFVDVKPIAGETSNFNVVWFYPTGAQDIPAGTYSIWTADHYTKYLSHFRIYPDDYALSQLYDPNKEGPYPSKMRVWPKAKKQEFYAWGLAPRHQPSTEGNQLMASHKAQNAPRVVPLSEGWNFAEKMVAGSPTRPILSTEATHGRLVQ